MRTARWMFVIATVFVFASCRSGDVAGNIVGSVIGGNWGDVSRAAVTGAVDSMNQQATKFSPEQEYYLGRAVAAEAVAKYGLDPNETNQEYVRRIGASIVALSTRLKGTYGGYHFAVLDSDIQNGISGPGGYVFITRGALERAQNEDEVAAILCHELGHVSLMHGERIIRQGRAWQAGMATILRIAAAAGDSGQQSLSLNITELLGDAADELVATLAETGYGPEFEFEADREGTLLLYDVGYDAAALQGYLKAAPGRQQGTWATHPPADGRIAALQPVVDIYGGPFDGGVGKAARTERYNRIMGGGAVSEESAPDPTPTASGTPMPPAPPAGPPAGFPAGK